MAPRIEGAAEVQRWRGHERPRNCCLLDHFIRSEQKRLRYCHPQRLCSPQVDYQIELGRLFVPGGTAATQAVMRATKTIPIVFRMAYDPVVSGLVASLAHPGGNVTGLSAASPEVNAKYLSLLKELMPGLKRIGVVESRNRSTLREPFTQSCRAAGIEPIFAEIAEGDVDGPIDRLAQLPTMAEDPDIVRQAGALMSYLLSEAEAMRRAASYIDRVLRGASPGDLPVERPSKFHLRFNLKPAKALGLTIPKELLLRADEVIQ